NNETGVLFPIPEVVAHCSARGIAVHVDAVQALGKVSPSFWRGADFVSLSGHKIYGPKGIGALLVASGRKLIATHFGGSQETKRRGGTEHVMGPAGSGPACPEPPPAETAAASLRGLRDRFEKQVGAIDGATIHGAGAERLPNTTSLRLAGIPSEVLLG